VILQAARVLRNYQHMKTQFILFSNVHRAPRMGICFASLSLMVLSGCASAPTSASNAQAPNASDLDHSWIAKPDRAYPADRYLVAVGSGSNREQAIADAKKSMAESFIVNVQSATESNANSSFNQNTNGGASGESKQEIQKKVSLHTDTYLRGAEVKQVATEGSTTYALLALDKLQARSGLLLAANQIKTDLDNHLNSLEEVYTQAKDDQARAKLAEFENLYGEASALGMSALVDITPMEVRLNRIENGVRKKNQNLAFFVRTVQGETYFERDIESCINDRGGVLYDEKSTGAEKANRVEITVVERPQHLPIEGWTKIRFDLTAAIIQADGRKYRIQTTQTETGRSRNAVLEALSDKLSKDLCNQLFNRINEMSSKN